MKRFISLLIAVTMLQLPVVAENKLPAFPGAAGGGMYATGGRGGTVYKVTNLNDSGAGSFRDAVSGSNRIVVFDVGGTIELKSDVVVKSNVTIAGQTAPGGAGITLKNKKIGLGGTNIIMRYISSRPGETGGSENDGLGGSAGSNSIIDHCSIGWANDEQFGLYSKLNNFTTQYTIIGPANSWSYHSKGVHGFGVMFGEKNHSMHHCLLAHNVSRNVRWKSPQTYPNEFVNNVIYNWAYQTSYGTLGHVNYVGNYLKNGPNTVSAQTRFMEVTDNANFKVYLQNNKVVDKDGVLYSTETKDNWQGIKFSGTKNKETTELTEHKQIISEGSDVSVAINADTPDVAYEKILNYVGASISKDKRTPIDAQVVNETKTGTGSITGARPIEDSIGTDYEAKVKEYGIQYTEYVYPETSKEIPPIDNDNDGMPDEWEIARGLNPNDASDATGDYLGQGYNNIEYYINDLTVNSFPEGVVTLSKTLNDSNETTQTTTMEIATQSTTIETTTQSTTQNDIIYGDVDKNGTITASDAAQLLSNVLNSDYPLSIDFEYADVDNSGILTAADASQILQKVLNSDFSFIAEK